MSFMAFQGVRMSLSRVAAFTAAGMAQRRPTSARYPKRHRRPNISFKADGFAAA
jgi:hypothetical protein